MIWTDLNGTNIHINDDVTHQTFIQMFDVLKGLPAALVIATLAETTAFALCQKPTVKGIENIHQERLKVLKFYNGLVLHWLDKAKESGYVGE